MYNNGHPLWKFYGQYEKIQTQQIQNEKIDEESNGAVNGVDDIDDVYVDQSVWIREQSIIFCDYYLYTRMHVLTGKYM